MAKQNTKQIEYVTVKLRKSYPARFEPDAVVAIEEYQALMLDEQNLMVSTNKAINALVIFGMQYIRNSKPLTLAEARKQAHKVSPELAELATWKPERKQARKASKEQAR